MQDLNWNDLRFVLAVSRCKSLAEASRTLGVNESTVARRIAHAESSLGTRLFERNSGVLTPTKAGEIVVSGSERVELEAQSIENTVTGIDQLAAGTVRLTAVPIIMNHILVPAIPKLIRKHPDLLVELIAEPRDLSLTNREADIALRLARPTREVRSVARRIGRLDYAIYARSGEQEEHLPWIAYDDSMRDLLPARWIANQINQDNLKTSVTANDAESILASVKAGLGKSLLPVAIATLEPNLVRLDDLVPISREMWLMVHPELRQLTRIKTVVNWAISTVEQIQ